MGRDVFIVFELIREIEKAEDPAAGEKTAPADPQSDPTIRSAINLFGGRLIQ